MRTPVDFTESYDGDFVIEGGDLGDTGISHALAIFQAIRSVLNNKPGEYPLFPNMGFNPDNYVGDTVNNRETGIALSQSIRQAIINNTSLYTPELDVEAFPLGKHKIAFRIKVRTVADNGQGLLLAYDTAENMLSFIMQDDPQQKEKKIYLATKINISEA